MRLGDLLGAEVRGPQGEPVGVVTDVRLEVRRTPASGDAFDLRLVGLLVSRRHTGSLLGYERGHSRGPWLVRMLVRLLHRGARYVPWSEVVSTGPPLRIRSSTALVDRSAR